MLRFSIFLNFDIKSLLKFTVPTDQQRNATFFCFCCRWRHCSDRETCDLCHCKINNPCNHQVKNRYFLRCFLCCNCYQVHLRYTIIETWLLIQTKAQIQQHCWIMMVIICVSENECMKCKLYVVNMMFVHHEVDYRKILQTKWNALLLPNGFIRWVKQMKVKVKQFKHVKFAS